MIMPSAAVETQVLALAGNPNCGKTTLFNALTGMRQRVANYPGVTVEKKTGRCQLGNGRQVEVVDLPGTYSLRPTSPDEQVAMEVLRGLRDDTPAPQVVVAVVDASNLARNLYLVSQLLELGRPVVVALNMTDVAERRGRPVDTASLAAELGVPVVAVVGRTGAGVDRLRQALAAVAAPPAPPAVELPAALAAERDALAALMGAVPGRSDAALRLLAGDEAEDLRHARAQAGAAVAAARARLGAQGIDPEVAEITARYRWIDAVVARCTAPVPAGGHERTLTERVDAVLVHRVWGLLIFAAIMATLFVGLFLAAEPLMNGIEALVGALAQAVTGGMAEGTLRSLLRDGVFGGVGAVVVFVPQIAILFLFLALLEDSGYLARAAFLMDRLLAKLGLHGRSFIPLLSSFACAVPGIMAARTIASPRERLATMLVAPFMSCSARLPVYGLLIAAFFASYGALAKGGILLACYLLGIAAAAATAGLAKVFLGRDEATPFILEMPTYQVPQPGQVLRHMWQHTWAFLARAGGIIVAVSILLWALAYFPRLPEPAVAAARSQAAASLAADASAEERSQAQDRAEGAAQLAHSAAGRIGTLVEPVIAPLGFDWKMGIGLIGAFAAREVFVSTMGVVYGVGDVGDDDTPLRQAMVADRGPGGAAVWTPAVAVSLLVWFVLAMQCMSTVAVMKRETGGWRWPLAQLAYMNLLAWVGAFAAYRLALLVWP